MFSHYSTFIQIIATVYFSMCFDGLIKRLFWTERFYKNLSDQLKYDSQGFLNEQNAMELKGLVVEYSNRYALKVARLASIMFAFCLLILFLSGYELHLPVGEDVKLYNAVQFVDIVVLLAFAAQFVTNKHFILHKWKYSISTIVVVYLLFLLSRVYLSYMDPFFNCSISKHAVVSIFIFIAVTPIVLLLIRSWLSSAIYLNYMKDLMNTGKAEYMDDFGKIIAGENSGNDSVPEAESQAQSTEDSKSIAGILEGKFEIYGEKMHKGICDAINNPSFFTLLAFWFRRVLNIVCSWKKSLVILLLL